MVGLGRPIKGEQVPHHVLHLILLGRALPHHGELYLARGVLAHGKAALGAGHERRPAGLAVAKAAVTFCPNQTVSMPTHSGRKRSTTAPIWWWIFMRRSANGRDAGVATQP